MSKIVVDTLEDRSAAETVDASYIVHGTAKAWVQMNGSGTIAIDESLNVTSLTDNGTGDYDVNLTNALTTTDYPVTGSCYLSANTSIFIPSDDAGTDASTMHFTTTNAAGTLIDCTYNVAMAFGVPA